MVSLTARWNERATGLYTGQIVDELGAGIPAGTLTTLTLTLYNKSDSSIINSRDGQNVLNVNGVTVDSSGNLAWTATPADNVIVDSTLETELHIALFKWTWAGSKAGDHEVAIRVVNLNKVPT